MIDTDKYEGHIENIGRWQMFANVLPRWAEDADRKLVSDAPLLLAEVKRLREESDEQYAYIKRLSEQLARATKWAYKQVLHNDSAMMDFDDYVWGEKND